MISPSVNARGLGEAASGVNRIASFMQSEDALQVAGYSAQGVVREHFQALEETRPNKMGWPRQHYWSQARRSTTFYTGPGEAIVVIPQIGMRAHYYGADIEPGRSLSVATGLPTRFLTIPACAEAYGHRASEFDLVMVWGADGPYALALAVRAERMTPHGEVKVTTKPGKIMFTLKRMTVIPPDPSVLPNREEITSAVGIALRAAVGRRFQNQYVDTMAGFDAEI